MNITSLPPQLSTLYPLATPHSGGNEGTATSQFGSLKKLSAFKQTTDVSGPRRRTMSLDKSISGPGMTTSTGMELSHLSGAEAKPPVCFSRKDAITRDGSTWEIYMPEQASTGLTSIPDRAERKESVSPDASTKIFQRREGDKALAPDIGGSALTGRDKPALFHRLSENTTSLHPQNRAGAVCPETEAKKVERDLRFTTIEEEKGGADASIHSKQNSSCGANKGTDRGTANLLDQNQDELPAEGSSAASVTTVTAQERTGGEKAREGKPGEESKSLAVRVGDALAKLPLSKLKIVIGEPSSHSSTIKSKGGYLACVELGVWDVMRGTLSTGFDVWGLRVQVDPWGF